MPMSGSRHSTAARRGTRDRRESRSRSSPRSPCPTWRRHREPSAWPGPTCQATSMSMATCTRRCPGWPARSGSACRCPSGSPCCPSSAVRSCWLAGSRRRRRKSGSTAGGCRGAGTRGTATPPRSRTTTTCPTPSTSGCSARPWPTPARATRAPTPPWSRRRSTSSTSWPGRSGWRPGMRLLDVGCGWGGMVHARGPQVPGPGARESRCPSSRRPGRSMRSRKLASRTWPRSGTWTTARSARPGSTPSARSG